MRFGLLGPLAVADDDGTPVDVGGRQPRLVLAALVAAGGRPVRPDELIDLVWADRQPASAAGTLQSYISRLRRLLDNADGTSLVLDDAGYRLDLSSHHVDIDRFDELAEHGHDELAAGRPVAARRLFVDALSLWRGPALVELVDEGAAMARAATLEERRLIVLEGRIDADLALGRHRHVIGELHALVAEHPLREGLHARLALALYRAGRQAEALRALNDAGRLLREELGLEPSPDLRGLETGILNHDPSLAPPPIAIVDGVDGADSAFIGRHVELGEMLAAHVEAAEDARFVVIEGEPGIGKTRLASEFAAIVDDPASLIVWARSNELGAAPALSPWLEVVRAVISRVDHVPPVLAETLAGEAPLVPGGGGALRGELFDAIATILEVAGADAPCVVVLDDLQWCDPASLDLLTFLASRLQRGVMVVVTVRTLEVGRVDHVTDALGAIACRSWSRRLRIGGLAPTATRQLLDAVVGAPVDGEVSSRIHDRAEGNPFYTLELARLLDAPGSESEEVPATVRDAIRRRLGHLSAETLDVLAVAALVGRDVDLPLIAHVTGLSLSDCLDRLEPAAADRLLVPAPRAANLLWFNHALVREVLVDGLTPLRRARLHLAVADALEALGVGNDDLELLADHLWRAAALGVAARAADALERAAEIAIGRVSYTAAEDMLRRAVQLRASSRSSRRDEQAQLAAQRRLLDVMHATRYFSGTDRDLIHTTLELATQLGQDDVSRELAWSEWAALSRGATISEARAVADDYIERWASHSSPLVRASAHVIDGVTEWSRGHMDTAIEQLERATNLFGTTSHADSNLNALQSLIADSFRLYCYTARGDMTPDQALDAFDEILATLPTTAIDGRHQPVYALACRVAAVHTRWPALDRLVTRAANVDATAQFAFFGGQVLLYRSLLEAHRGDLDTALSTCAEGTNRYRAVGGRTGTATCHALLAEQLARAGRLADAAELARAARAETTETGETVNEIPVLIAEAIVAATSGDKRAASERLAAAILTGQEQNAQALAARARVVAAELSIPI